MKEKGLNVKVFTPKIPINYILKEEREEVSVKRIYSLDPFHIPFLSIEGGKGKRDFISFPDNKIGFLPFLINNLEKSDIFITSSPPFSIHLAGLFLKKRGYKWIAEFRDPYTDGPIGKYLFPFENSIAKSLEKMVVEKADAVVTLSFGLEKEFKKRYKNKRIITITNGYSESDFLVHPEEKEEKFVLTYLGTLNKTHKPDNIISALEILSWRIKNLEEIFKFRVIGYVIDDYLKVLNKFPFFRYEGYLPRKEAIKKMLSSHTLLLILTEEESRFAIPGKTFNYLRSGIPILLVSGDGALKEFLKEYSIISRNEPEEIASKIKMCLEKGIKKKRFPNIEKYEWRNISQLYYELIMKCLKN